MNPIRPPVSGDGLRLDVKHIFPTIQGEGPNAGVPAVFIRLGGCNLACEFCDTEFEDFEGMALEEIVRRAREVRGACTLAVITGGEPLRQNIAPLCEALMAKGFRVQIETNGTLYRKLPAEVEIVCSPKYTQGGYAPIRGDLLAEIGALKFLVAATRAGYDGVPQLGQREYGIPVYVQPMDEYDAAKNAANVALAARLALAEGYRLSMQIHKIIGVE
jgi:organic radical activating enzyme